ncbi:MAG TPA: HEAT repeat domain-containing protein [Gemmataceae bacterium]|nr:HEAT repeat domain-containing protein [Gemmataceae bacterium]
MPRRAIFFLAVCASVGGCGKREKSTAELIADLKGSSARDQLIAVRLLPQRKGDAAQVIPALTEALKDKDNDIRLSAAIGLGSFGEEAKEAVPALQAARQDKDARIREAATVALKRIDPAAAPKADAKR